MEVFHHWRWKDIINFLSHLKTLKQKVKRTRSFPYPPYPNFLCLPPYLFSFTPFPFTLSPSLSPLPVFYRILPTPLPSTSMLLCGGSPQDHPQVWVFSGRTQYAAYSCTKLLMAMIYYSKSIQGKISGGKGTWVTCEGNQAQAPSGVTQISFISLAMNCDSLGEAVYQGSSLETQCLEFLIENWPLRHFLLSMCQNSRRPEGM